jgi:hypothetical protein
VSFSILPTDYEGNVGASVSSVSDGSSVLVDLSPPQVTLVGAATVSVEAAAAYSEQGATAQDSIGGDVSASITITGTVNTAVPAPMRSLTRRATLREMSDGAPDG